MPEVKVMRDNIWKGYVNKHGEVKCFHKKCRKVIKIDDEYVPRRSSGRYSDDKKSPIYCVKCATVLKII